MSRRFAILPIPLTAEMIGAASDAFAQSGKDINPSAADAIQAAIDAAPKLSQRQLLTLAVSLAPEIGELVQAARAVAAVGAGQFVRPIMSLDQVLGPFDGLVD
ncbi:hypothetical protein [Nitrospirillum sp. BR 11163]|uniref:hypothetical protein n=1 Tax=Nitrospirillum sp. BR 11163 TaxID=3104323 RepID=UPI002B002CF4|nr:hypothetical protein [Nitrospirillum sp. BR 11163]MEA1673309.1 hypothetical protein [Nitrospirillum sp. BR 11163]